MLVRYSFVQQLAFCLLVRHVVSLQVAQFTNPSSQDFSTTYILGEAVTVAWANAQDYTMISLGLFPNSQFTNDINWILSNSVGYTANSFNFRVSFGNMKVTVGPFRFVLVNGTNYGNPAYSTYFNIDSSSTSSTSSTSSSSSSSPSSTSSSSSSPQTTTTPSASGAGASTTSPATVSPQATDTGLSTGGKIGIGIGVGLVAIAAIIAVGFFFLRRRKREAEVVALPSQYGNGPIPQFKQYQPPSEMHASPTSTEQKHGSSYSDPHRGHLSPQGPPQQIYEI